MSKITIKLSGVGAELVLGDYMPKDATIYNNWEEFYHFNNLIHESQLMMVHIAEMEITQDDSLIYKGRVPATQMKEQKSTGPAMEHHGLYLRTECAEQSVYQIQLETEQFDIRKLTFETQDYDLLFKVGRSFLAKVTYEEKALEIVWISGKPVGNICLLCRYENGYLVPVYDAVKKIGAISM
jgi:hypothetical protein